MWRKLPGRQPSVRLPIGRFQMRNPGSRCERIFKVSVMLVKVPATLTPAGISLDSPRQGVLLYIGSQRTRVWMCGRYGIYYKVQWFFLESYNHNLCSHAGVCVYVCIHVCDACFSNIISEEEKFGLNLHLVCGVVTQGIWEAYCFTWIWKVIWGQEGSRFNNPVNTIYLQKESMNRSYSVISIAYVGDIY